MAAQIPQPAQFARRVLLLATGLTTQVITETIYVLSILNKPPFVPTEVHLVTTKEGAERVRLTLLSENPGWFHRLCKDYSIEGISFGEESIHTIASDESGELDDIRTEKDNEEAADFITEKIREFTADPAAALHVSIAGGRKTMGFYAGYALSLFGRAQDRLSHVLVPPPYESNQQFYYPTPYSSVVFTNPPETKPLDCKDALVTLAEIPFVRLRPELPRTLLLSKVRYSQAVEAANRSLGPKGITIDLKHQYVTAAGRQVQMSAALMAFLSWMLRAGINGRGPLACPKDGVPNSAYAREFLQEYRRITGEMADERTMNALKHGMDKSFFEQHKCRVNTELKAALGFAAQPYLIKRFGRRPSWTHGFDLEPGAINFV